MKRIKLFEQFVNESKTIILYRLVGGGQFGGSPIKRGSEPKPNSIITGVFATPHIDAIDAMIEYSLDQGEDEMTGNPIKETDMRICVIETQSARKPKPHEKFMHWDDSDTDEMFIQTGKILKVLTVNEWDSFK